MNFLTRLAQATGNALRAAGQGVANAAKSAREAISKPFKKMAEKATETPNEAPQATTPETPKAPKAETPKTDNPTRNESPSQEELRQQKIQEDFEKAMDEKMKAREEANKGKNELVEDDVKDGEEEKNFDRETEKYQEEEGYAQHGSDPYRAAEKYLEEEDLANIHAHTSIVNGKAVQRGEINRYTAVERLSLSWKKMDRLGDIFTWTEMKLSKGKLVSIERTGTASQAYLSGQVPWIEIWQKAGHALKAEYEALPYRGEI